MAQVLIRTLAQEDLLSIWSFLAFDSVERADLFLTQLDEKFNLLAENPMLGRERKELSFSGLRSFPVRHYVIFYTPIPEGIEIIRILHGKQDIEKLLG